MSTMMGPVNIYALINKQYMAALKLIGTGEVTRDRKIAALVFGQGPDGSKGLSVTFHEQLFKDSIALNEKVQISWNFTEAMIGSAIPEVQALLEKMDNMLLSDTQAESLVIEP